MKRSQIKNQKRIVPIQVGLKTCGKGYVEKALRLAPKIDLKAKLSYNDYNLVNPIKKEKVFNLISALLKKGVPIQSIDMQGHWSMQDLDPTEIKKK